MKRPNSLFFAPLILVTLTGACSEDEAPRAVAAVATGAASGDAKGAAAADTPETPAKAPASVLAEGVLELPPGAEAKGALVFVSLRPVGGGGPPIAALRVPAGPFPMAFSLTSENVIAMGGAARPVPDEFVLKATLDVDGNPMVKSPDDLTITSQMKKGTMGAKLVLEKAAP